jgi:type III restriction enzyme
MKIKYDANQKFQQDAIASVVDLFEGQPGDADTFLSNIKATQKEGQLFAYEIGAVGNSLVLGDEAILENLKYVQNNKGLPVSNELDGMNFSVEMETGTGKTYVYLRTVFELAKKYNFTKFIILVPSVAIKEGVKTSIESMRQHFFDQYALPFDLYVYDGKSPESVQSFATSTNIQIMIMTIQGIKGDKSRLIFHQQRNQLNGIAPVEYMSATNPIVIMDEPQNMESDLSSGAIEKLSPMCTLRYSATHKNEYNLVYRLDPIDAHKFGLVKEITVASAQQVGGDAKAYLRLIEVTNINGIEAKVEVLARGKSGNIAKKIIKVKKDDDLHHLTKNDAYQNGYLVNELSTDPQYLELSGIGIVKPDDTQEDNSETIHKEMIRETIREHFAKAYRTRELEVKVLSLFFVDKVSSYLEYNETGEQIEGNFAKWFDEIYKAEYERSKLLFTGFEAIMPEDPNEVRKAYFAEMKKAGITKYVDTSGATKTDDDAYDLIMRGKERLLDINEPARFIFSHSALKEGWDNPNVFQICMMRESNSELDRRQTIGRGLRLPVRQGGTRVHDRNVNQLTVIANESYTEFANSLQSEYKKSGIKIGYVRKEEFAKITTKDDKAEPIGYNASASIWQELMVRGMIDDEGRVLPNFEPKRIGFTLNLSDDFKVFEPEIKAIVSECKLDKFIKNAKKRVSRQFNKEVLYSPELEKLWKKISRKTTYRVEFDSNGLVASAIAKIKKEPPIQPLRISVAKNKFELTRGGVKKGAQVSERSANLSGSYEFPNIVKELQEATSLTRRTIIDIVVGSGRLNEFIHNPNDFIQMVKRNLQIVLSDTIIDGIEYEKLDDYVYELRELQRDSQQEAARIVDQLYKVKNNQKSIVDYIPYDSNVEHDFAEFLDNREDIKLFLKLPDRFVVDTPVGNYNPDWAIVKEVDGEEKIFMIRETKGSQQEDLLRGTELAKINCAKKHFSAIGVENYAKSSPSNWNI